MSGACGWASSWAHGSNPGPRIFIVNPLTGRGMDNLFSTHPVAFPKRVFFLSNSGRLTRNLSSAAF